MPFEYAVRPFQSRDSFGRTILPSTPSGNAERATLTWGSKASVGPGALPKPTSMGSNIACCNEVITQNGAEASPTNITISGPDAGGQSIALKRSDVVLAKKKDQNNCDDWLMNNSYAASGIKQAFGEMESLIHASDAAFMPSGSTPECTQKTSWSYNRSD